MPPDMMRPVAGRGQVVGPGQAGDAVEDDDDVARPSSTMRLARSMASSATWVCSSAGRSKVEAMTSPLHRPAHVGDLFGPLVDEQHDELHLGVVALDRLGDLSS